MYGDEVHECNMVGETPKPKKETNRRKYLKTAGLAAVSLPALATVGKGKEQPQVIFTTRPYNDEISVKRINKTRSDLAQESDSLPSNPDMGVSGWSSAHGDSKIVSFVAGIDAKGRLHQRIGLAARPRDVRKAHKIARQEKKKLESSLDTVDASSGDYSTSASSWNTYESSKVTNYSDPYGDLVCYYQYEYQGDARVYKERFAMFPGSQEYNSAYDNDRGNVKHQWNSNSTELMDWEPFNGTSGTVNETFTVRGTTDGGLSVSYSYGYNTSETTVYDKTSDRNNIAEFDVDYYGSSKTTTSGFEPASLVDITGSSYPYLDMTDTATFRFTTTGGYTGTEDLVVNKNFSY